MCVDLIARSYCLAGLAFGYLFGLGPILEAGEMEDAASRPFEAFVFLNRFPMAEPVISSSDYDSDPDGDGESTDDVLGRPTEFFQTTDNRNRHEVVSEALAHRVRHQIFGTYKQHTTIEYPLWRDAIIAAAAHAAKQPSPHPPLPPAAGSRVIVQASNQNRRTPNPLTDLPRPEHAGCLYWDWDSGGSEREPYLFFSPRFMNAGTHYYWVRHCMTAYRPSTGMITLAWHAYEAEE